MINRLKIDQERIFTSMKPTNEILKMIKNMKNPKPVFKYQEFQRLINRMRTKRIVRQGEMRRK